MLPQESVFPYTFSLEYCLQAFIKTAATIYKKIQDGVFDISNEVRIFHSPFLRYFTLYLSMYCLLTLFATYGYKCSLQVHNISWGSCCCF